MIIQGFSKFTDYNCMSCHAKCCATEYILPLVGAEMQNLRNNFPEISLYLHTSTFGDQLLRGDSCFFLSQSGICKIHDTKYKPISCEIFPLILWRFSQNDVLVWIAPCRGRSFTWHSDNESNLNKDYFQHILKKSKAFFESYWGEEIDRTNPYINVPIPRIYEQVEFYKSIENESILQTILKKTQNTKYNQITNQLDTNWVFDSNYSHLRDLVNSVLIWLSWSPVGLQLSHLNSQRIFSIAALLIIDYLNRDQLNDYEEKQDAIHLNHLGSYLATSLLPSFWKNIRPKLKNKLVVSFSDQVIHVLNGSIPQQSIHEFMDK